jgi:hypothetical protein
MWFVFRLGGNPYCNMIDSILKSSVCRFNKSSPLLPLNPSNIFISRNLGDIVVVSWILDNHHSQNYANLQRKTSLNNCGFVSNDSNDGNFDTYIVKCDNVKCYDHVCNTY